MIFDQFSDKAHFFVLWELQPGEDAGDHAAADHFMAVKGPAQVLFKLFGCRLPDIVQDGSPAKPEVVGIAAYVIEHL